MKIHCQQLQWIHLCQKFSQVYLPLCQYTFQISKKFSLMLEASSWIIQFKDTKDANYKIAGLIQLWCTSIFEFNKALTKTFDRIVLGTVLMVRCSYSTAAATTLALVMQQLQHCTSYAVAIALHQAPIRDFIIATTQINIYIYIYILPPSQQHINILFSHQKDTILLICINCLLKKYKVPLKIKRTLTITNFELQQNSINNEFHNYNLQAPKYLKKKKKIHKL